MAKLVISSKEQLVAVFPTLTQAQIIKLYKQAEHKVKYLSFLDASQFENASTDEIYDKWKFYKECEEFLGAYLARCYCVANGYHILN